jgi:dTDP-4-dehydrorhamnose reductase
MKILVTGAYGQLGNEIKDRAKQYEKWQFLFTDVDTLDISKKEEVLNYFEKNKPDFVINAAAYTAVDKAENDQQTANAINAIAPGYLAAASKKVNARFIHVSTDYVFDGDNFQPYNESNEVNPKTFYGKSKLDGESNCLSENPDSLIIRTSWLYSSYGNNFVKTMLRLGKERDELNVVYDQVGSPTYAGDLAQAILSIIEISQNKSESFVPGIYHFSNEGAISWYDFAKSIFEISGLNCKVNPILSKEFKMDAPRPFYSVMDKSKIKNTYSLKIPYWKESLIFCLEKLNKAT